MISNLLLSVLYYSLVALVSPLTLLDDYALPASVASALSTAGNYLANVDALIPASTLLAVLAAFLAVEGGLFLYKGIKWIYNKIPGVN